MYMHNTHQKEPSMWKGSLGEAMHGSVLKSLNSAGVYVRSTSCMGMCMASSNRFKYPGHFPR